ncbi:MAG: hypothetical protein IV085_09995 [Thiobacillus sp.]|nr:hypothetical protein [Thiobacillus sp.]
MHRALVLLWAFPVTLLGLLIVLIARLSGGDAKRVDGVLESAGGWPARALSRGFPFSGPVAALTLGHVVIGASAASLEGTRAHERVHVRQFERWGALMLVLYPLAGLVAWMRGGDPYRDNRFEREARAGAAAVCAAQGGFEERSVNR